MYIIYQIIAAYFKDDCEDDAFVDSNIVIVGRADSYAEEYATRLEFLFLPQE